VKGLKARGNVEDWLGKVEESMFVSLRKLVRMAMTDYELKSREDWVLQHASQVGSTSLPEHFRDNSPVSPRHPARQQPMDPTLSPPCREAMLATSDVLIGPAARLTPSVGCNLGDGDRR